VHVEALLGRRARRDSRRGRAGVGQPADAGAWSPPVLDWPGEAARSGEPVWSIEGQASGGLRHSPREERGVSPEVAVADGEGLLERGRCSRGPSIERGTE